MTFTSMGVGISRQRNTKELQRIYFTFNKPMTGWLGTVYIWGTFGQKMKNSVP